MPPPTSMLFFDDNRLTSHLLPCGFKCLPVHLFIFIPTCIMDINMRLVKTTYHSTLDIESRVDCASRRLPCVKFVYRNHMCRRNNPEGRTLGHILVYIRR